MALVDDILDVEPASGHALKPFADTGSRLLALLSLARGGLVGSVERVQGSLHHCFRVLRG